ncbi:hypothetical protein [Nocardioides sp. W7]|uniref:hypothetical protein n=1 Tax=Nocardioides sp. W7 TaxID=2931390 RepID=UPI001FD016EF|nr:hypothetical protein [Nocardioides sp. W7]
MSRLLLLLLRLHATLVAGARRRDDRGDVPGWVMVAVMTAGIVVVIGGVAREQLSGLLTEALSSVR